MLHQELCVGILQLGSPPHHVRILATSLPGHCILCNFPLPFSMPMLKLCLGRLGLYWVITRTPRCWCSHQVWFGNIGHGSRKGKFSERRMLKLTLRMPLNSGAGQRNTCAQCPVELHHRLFNTFLQFSDPNTSYCMILWF